MPKKTYDQLVTENKKIKELMTFTSETMRKACDDRYELQQENKKLKEEIDDLKSRLEDVNHNAEEWEDQFNELKEENKKLKEQIEEWKDVCASYHCETPDQLESWLCASIHEDDEEYSKYMEPLELREEVEELKKQIESLKKTNKQKTKVIHRFKKQVEELQKITVEENEIVSKVDMEAFTKLKQNGMMPWIKDE